MSHLNHDQLSALLDGALAGRERDRANAHLAECAECREELSLLTEADRSLATSLEHDPGEAYFDQFADRVMRTIAEPAREAVPPSSFWQKLMSPRGIAWAGGVAALLVAVGIGWIGWQDWQSPFRSTAARVPETSSTTAAPEAAPPQRASAEMKNEALRAKSKEGVAGGSDQRVRAYLQESRDAKRTAQAPDAGAKDGGAVSRNDEITSGLTDEAKLQAAPQNAPAPSQHQQAVRRTEAGEELPVKKSAPPASAMSAPAPAPAPAEKVGERAEAETQLKQRAALPLDKSLSGVAKSLTPGAQGFAAQPPTLGTPPGIDAQRELDATGNARIPGLATPSRPNASQWPEALRPLVARADRADRLANAVGTAASFDSSAVQWERVLAVTPVGPARVEASHHIAWARAQSFTIAPSYASRSNARVAIERYVDLAPPGLERERYRELLKTMP